MIGSCLLVLVCRCVRPSEALSSHRLHSIIIEFGRDGCFGLGSAQLLLPHMVFDRLSHLKALGVNIVKLINFVEALISIMSLRIHLLHLFGLVIILYFHLDIKFFSSLIKVFFEKTVEVKTMVIIYVVFGGET